MKIYIGTDHAGFPFKQKWIEHFSKSKIAAFKKIEIVDMGPLSEERVDYPDFADKVVLELLKERKLTSQVYGILICGSGQGMAMRANKYPGVRAALCWNEESAQLSRAHNDANILCLGSRLLSSDEAYKISEIFLQTPFEGERHTARVKKISSPVS